ncbi:ribose transport system ATP-binding protein [Palleronia marisminoris]|uniref:Ribose import ATP-binding protein RbsA n=1 Tax=Palleronia marisminoris TaxID=315423 RepID=A0A1Y5RZE6_9RHOB|nr:sugar ABC transporter ATP-binding protein [Palleronia marisminoris]SFG44836.1 ribose transport system ATP-binding protein [Palleronia marisminoris]SLN26450.1 Ribose import ATP-binding protein RbsA [Palleronia marisminoris]
MTDDVPMLEMRNISKTFGTIKALQDVSLRAYGGEVHSLMGENGAGKSTLMKVLSGAHAPDAGGEVLVDGAPIPLGDPKLSKARGVAVIYQELTLAPNLTVAQNVFLGAEPHRGGIVSRREMLERTQPILDRLGVTFDAGTKVSRLSLGERQLVEIARAMSTDAKIIVMDEPTTSLSERETDKLFQVIAGLKRDGIAVVYISHRMDEIYQLSDRCSVLRDGAFVGTLEKDEIEADRLVSMMVGRDLSSFYKKEHVAEGDAQQRVLRVEDIGDGVKVRGCSFEVGRGEVLGIAGLVGSGRTELLRLIYGADSASSGRVWLDGEDVTPRSPRDALRHGIAYLTEDRKELGLFLDMTLSDNINMAVAEGDARAGGLRNFRTAARRARSALDSLSIRAPSARANAGSLSGGNQQKVLLARLLEAQPKVLMLDEPTRGVDVGAKSEIYRLIDELARSGLAIVVVSSELPEIIGISDRCLVMREGKIAGEVSAAPGRSIEQTDIMALSTGAQAGTRTETPPKIAEKEGL